MSADMGVGMVSFGAGRGNGKGAPVWIRLLAFLATLGVAVTLGAVSIAHAAGTPTLVSDQADYPPGGVVVLTLSLIHI